MRGSATREARTRLREIGCAAARTIGAETSGSGWAMEVRPLFAEPIASRGAASLRLRKALLRRGGARPRGDGTPITSSGPSHQTT